MRRPFLLLLALAFTALSLSAAQIPRRAPEFVIQGNGGQQLLLSQYRGKVVLLKLFYTTCPHCQRSAGVLSRIQNEYGPKGLQVLGSAFDEFAPMMAGQFVQRYRTTYPVGYQTRDRTLAFLDHSPSQPFYVPIFVFIDKQGMIRAQHMGSEPFFRNEEANTRALIEKLLAEPAKPPARPKP
ncbi:MAG: TlpA family protein disulfide reductase [Bryobacterales bacterium]|nr:TlpA family protein disulfide reductase [Bryobacterales bacterium]